MTVFVSKTPGTLRNVSMHALISVMFGALMIVAISYCPVISYTVLTPCSFESRAETFEVSVEESTDIRIIARTNITR